MKNTLCHMFKKTVELYGERPACKKKIGAEYKAITYGELYDEVLALATAITRHGVEHQDAVGLISDNRLEWIICDLACLMAGAADVPRGSDSTTPELSYILKHSDSVAAFVENEAQLNKVLSIEGLVDAMKFIAVMDKKFTGSDHPKVVTVSSLIREGKKLLSEGNKTVEERLEALSPNDRATIIYTSGTTGEPKGVVLLHCNIMHNVRNVPDIIRLNHNDRLLSILPPWHIFERTVEYLTISRGASTAYTSIKTMGQDMALEKPTLIASVPRIWEGIYGKVMAAMAKEKPVKRKLFMSLLAVSKRYVQASRVLSKEDPVFHPESPLTRQKKVFMAFMTIAGLWLPYRFAQKKFAAIRAKTGGHLRAAISGGGALPGYVDNFFAAVGLTLLEGYGLTETSPVIAARRFDRRVMGTVGPLVAETEVKVVDEKGSSLGPGEKGAVLVRGELVMQGYYKRKDLTEQVFDAGGWFNTGDLGMMTARGELAIRGRAKETIVLMGGENVEPNPIEDKITESRFISQVIVVGQDKKVLGALVVPDEEAVREYFSGKGKPLIDSPISTQKEVIELLKSEISRLITEHSGFRPFERINKVKILDNEFKVGDELTHTLKKKRNVIYEKYRWEIEEIYM